MTYEVTNLARGLKHLGVKELKRWFSTDEAWEPTNGQRVSVELNHLGELPDLDWIVTKPSGHDLLRIDRTIKRDKLYVGAHYVVREISGSRTDRRI